MSRSARGPLRLAWLLASLLPAAGLAEEPTYFKRLDLPVAEDAIAYPQAVAADLASGEIFVCDTRRNRIVIFDTEALYLHQIPGGDTFSAPRDLAVDRDGYLFVVANHGGRGAVVELDFDGLFLREILLEGLPAEAAELQPTSVAVSPAGDRLYVLDAANLVVWIVDRDGPVQGSIDLAEGLGEQERDELMLGKLDVYGERLLLAVPTEGVIRIYDLDGRPKGRFGIKGTAPCRLAFPMAAALDDNGDLVVVDQQRMMIVRWRPEGNRCLGEHIGIGSAPGFLYFPMDLALDRAGRAFVSQGFQGRVQGYEGLVPAPSPTPPKTE